MVETVKQNTRYLLAKVVSIALNIGEECVEVDQRVSLQVLDCVEFVAFQSVDEQESIRVDTHVWFCAFGFMIWFALVNDQRGGWGFCFSDNALVFVDLEAGMQTQDGRIRVSVGRQSVKLESIGFVCDASEERLELVSLEWPRFVRVYNFDNHSVLLYVSHSKPLVGERSNEFSPFR